MSLLAVIESLAHRQDNLGIATIAFMFRIGLSCLLVFTHVHELGSRFEEVE